MTRLRKKPDNEIRLSNNPIVIKQFPVNNSAPVKTIMANPNGKNKLLKILDIPTSVTVWVAILAANAAKAIHIPANMASRNKFEALLAAFLILFCA